MSRYIDADALEKHKFVSWTVPEYFNEQSLEQQAYQLGWNNAIEAIIENEPTADVVSREKYDRLMKNAKIMCDALKEYERREDAEIHYLKPIAWMQLPEPWKGEKDECTD